MDRSKRIKGQIKVTPAPYINLHISSYKRSVQLADKHVNTYFKNLRVLFFLTLVIEQARINLTRELIEPYDWNSHAVRETGFEDG